MGVPVAHFLLGLILGVTIALLDLAFELGEETAQAERARAVQPTEGFFRRAG